MDLELQKCFLKLLCVLNSLVFSIHPHCATAKHIALISYFPENLSKFLLTEVLRNILDLGNLKKPLMHIILKDFISLTLIPRSGGLFFFLFVCFHFVFLQKFSLLESWTSAPHVSSPILDEAIKNRCRDFHISSVRARQVLFLKRNLKKNSKTDKTVISGVWKLA